MVAGAAALAAHKAGTLGVGLSGGGFVIPFVLGVLNMLYVELGILKHDMPVAGASTGALCTPFASGLVSMTAMRHTVEHVASKCRARGNCFGVLEKIVVEEARELLPADSAAKLNQQGRTYISVSFPSAEGDKQASFELVNTFNDTEDVLSALHASTFIPMWSATSMVTDFRGREAYDGSMAGSLDSFLPCPPGVSYCIRISTMPAGGSIPRGIMEDIILGSPEDKALLINKLLETANGPDISAKVGDLLQAFSGKGATRTMNRFNQWINGLMDLKMPGEGAADIWPGRRHPMPTSRLGWCTWTLAPPGPEERQAMFELGRKEALSWAQEQGFVAASKRVAPPEKLSSISMRPRKNE